MCSVMEVHWPDGARRVFGVYLYLTHLPRKRVNIGMKEPIVGGGL